MGMDIPPAMGSKATEIQPTPIRRRIDNLQEAQNDLYQVIERLENQLDRILTPAKDEPGSPLPTSVPELVSPLADELQGTADHANRMANRLRELIDRIEL